MPAQAGILNNAIEISPYGRKDEKYFFWNQKYVYLSARFVNNYFLFMRAYLRRSAQMTYLKAFSFFLVY